MLLHHVEHVGIVEAVIGHLDEDDPLHAAGTRVTKENFRCEGPRLHVFRCVAAGKGEARRGWLPDVDVGVDGSGGCFCHDVRSLKAG